MDSLKEIVSFMNIDSRLDLKAVSVSHVLSKLKENLIDGVTFDQIINVLRLRSDRVG